VARRIATLACVPRLVLAVVHLLSLALGMLALNSRSRALVAAERNEQLKPVFFWDAVYGAVAIAWLGSGLWRAFGGIEKGTDYYLANHAFWTKMLLLAALLAVESVLAVTFVRWRILVKKGETVSLANKARLVRLHHVEVWLVLGMVVMAALMARGVGVVKPKTNGAGPNVSGVDLALGESVYRRYCVTCHQVDGRGLDGKLAADFRTSERLEKSDAALAASVANGVPGTAMAAFRGELGDDEIRSVVAYVRKTYGKNGAP
jgi:putative membrane protein